MFLETLQASVRGLLQFMYVWQVSMSFMCL